MYILAPDFKKRLFLSLLRKDYCESTCAASCMFSLLLLTNLNVIFIKRSILLLVKEFKLILKSTTIPFFSLHFFNVDSSFDIENRLLKFSVVVLGIIMGGMCLRLFINFRA